MGPENPQVVWHAAAVSREQREALNHHAGCVVWFTGLSGSGKSTVANLVDQRLNELRVRSFLLDGDNVRHGLNATPQLLAPRGLEYAKRFGLGFGPEDREENIRRVGCVAELMVQAGLVVLTAFVSPYRQDRRDVRERVTASGRPSDFIEVFVDTPLEVCEARDPKGLYQKARRGEISFFTGITDPYEAPEQPEIHLLAAEKSPQELADVVVRYLQEKNIIPAVL